MLENLGEGEAGRAIDAAVRRGFASGRIPGIEAGSAPTQDVARAVAEAL